MQALTSDLGTDDAGAALACQTFGLKPAIATAHGSSCMICPSAVRAGPLSVLLEGWGGRWGS